MVTNKLKTRREQSAQERLQVLRFIAVTYRSRTTVNLRMFDEHSDTRVIGVIERIDSEGGRFMVDGEWFRSSDIVELGIQKRRD